jgi:uncharacterized membrane protein YraQ (UPF0718 family)
MNTQQQSKQDKKRGRQPSLLKRWGPVLVVFVAYGALAWFSPGRFNRGVQGTWKYLLTMISIFPAMVVLSRLLQAWIPARVVLRLIGDKSGLRGTALALGAGTLGQGPVYVSYPLGGSLLTKGASLQNVVTFLGAWSVLKWHLLPLEAEFLGWGFAVLRLALLIPGVVLSGWLTAFIIDRVGAGDIPAYQREFKSGPRRGQ